MRALSREPTKKETQMASSILVVDDAAFMRMMIRDILVREGYVIHEAVNGRDAIEKYSEVKPDLVTMDITMPEMDGITALREIRTTNPDAKILMVSAMGQQKMIVEALEFGALDFLVKPFQPTKVLETVKKCLEASAG
jgi:two-component system chemotaxis response regulator CheY